MFISYTIGNPADEFVVDGSVGAHPRECLLKVPCCLTHGDIFTGLREIESHGLSHLSGKTPSLMMYVTMLFTSYPNSKISLTLNLRNVLIRLTLSTSMNRILREFNLVNLSSLVPVLPLEETTTFPITPAGSKSKEVFVIIKGFIVKGLRFINHYTSNIRIIIDKSKP